MTQSLDTDCVVLGPYEELCGGLVEIRRTDTEVVVELSAGTLRYPSGSREATLCAQELAGNEGSRVGILRVPATDEPLRFRVDNSQ